MRYYQVHEFDRNVLDSVADSIYIASDRGTIDTSKGLRDGAFPLYLGFLEFAAKMPKYLTDLAIKSGEIAGSDKTSKEAAQRYFQAIYLTTRTFLRMLNSENYRVTPQMKKVLAKLNYVARQQMEDSARKETHRRFSRAAVAYSNKIERTVVSVRTALVDLYDLIDEEVIVLNSSKISELLKGLSAAQETLGVTLDNAEGAAYLRAGSLKWFDTQIPTYIQLLDRDVEVIQMDELPRAVDF
jgi:hypothetical protein